jgi:rRNA maturation endonuclease Nob1
MISVNTAFSMVCERCGSIIPSGSLYYLDAAENPVCDRCVGEIVERVCVERGSWQKRR